MPYTVLILGACGVGKSTFINKYLDNNQAKILHENRAHLAGIARQTTSINRYRASDYELIDTPGLFDNMSAVGIEGSSEDLERILDNIKHIDYIIICISVNKLSGVSLVDSKVKKIIDSYDFPKNRTFIYLTKSDMLNRMQRDCFIANYQTNPLFKNHKTFIWEDISCNDIEILLYDRYKIFRYITSNYNIEITDIIDDKFNMPVIKKIQKYMIDHELYPPSYKKYYDEANWFYKLFCDAYFSISAFKHKNINFELKLTQLKGIKNNMIPFYDTIYYKSGNKFYEGTFVGNNFHIGTFYYDDTQAKLYHKNC